MSLYDELLWMKECYKNSVAFRTASGDEKTYEDLWKNVCNKACDFRKVKYDRIAVIAATSYEWLCYVYGAVMVGKTVVLVDPLLPMDNLRILLKNMDVEAVWTDVEDSTLRDVIESACCMEMNVFQTVDRACERLPNDMTFEDGELLFFTSGTTSHAKGVILPIEASYTNCKNLSEQLMCDIEGVVYAPLPLYHIYTYTLVFAFLYQGRTICLGNTRRIINELQSFKPEILVVVPSIAEFLMQNNYLNTEVKAMTVAGAKCEKRLEVKAKEQNVFIQNLYGASESAGTIGLNMPGYGVDELIPAKGVEIFWENDNEIVLRTISKMKEYYKNPEATNKVLRGDKLITGDIGEKNANGTFQPLGRKDDVIAMKNGDKLYCNEVDEELSALEGVNEACTVYIDGKIIAVAVVQQQNRALAEKAIKAYNKKQPYYRKLEDVWIREEALPRTRIGKLKRREVEEQYRQYEEGIHE